MPEEAPLKPEPPSPGRWIKENIAQMGSMVIVALPVWLFHWNRTRRIAYAKRTFFPHRIYLYLVMVITLITALTYGGKLVNQALKLIVGTVDWAKPVEAQIFWKDILSAAINSSLALGLWFYHWRLVERVPDASDITGSKA